MWQRNINNFSSSRAKRIYLKSIKLFNICFYCLNNNLFLHLFYTFWLNNKVKQGDLHLYLDFYFYQTLLKSFLTHFCLLIFNIQHFCSCVSIFFHPQHLIICFIPCQHQIVLKDSCMNMIRCIFSLICRPSIHFLNGVGWRYACQWQQAGPSRPQRRNPLRMGRVLWRPESRSGALWQRLCASVLPVLHCNFFAN